MSEEQITREKLQAWREEYVTDKRVPGGGLPFNLEDDMHHVKIFRQHGWDMERLLSARDDLPPEYWESIGRFIDQDSGSE